MVTRRTFLLGAGAMGIIGCRMRCGFERPLFRAGIVTDTHVLPDPASLERVRRAYRLFRDRKVSLIANLGDIADVYSPEAYRLYAAARALAYPDAARRPKEVFLWANHDRIDFTPGVYASSYEDSFAAAKPVLGMTNGMYDRFEMGGYVFLVFPQDPDPKRCEAMVANAAADSPDRPFFVMCHVPPGNTTYGTGSRDSDFTRLLAKYPHAVNFCGHTHGSLRNVRMIWQGAFTSVNFGCLQGWSGDLLGRTPERVESWDCAVLSFYADRLVIHRHSLKDGLEIEPDDPWTLVWGDLTCYRTDVRAARVPTPQFPAGAALAFRPDAEPMSFYEISVPAADRSRQTLGYRLRIDRRTADGWQPLALRELRGDFHREGSEPAAAAFVDRLPAAFFDEGAEYRCSAEPYGFYDNVGRRIEGTFVAPKKKPANVVCEVADGLPTLYGGGKWRLPDVVQRFPGGTKFRLVLDADSERAEDESLCFRLQCFPKKEILSGWIVCESGKVSRRYVLGFVRGSSGQDVYLASPFSSLPAKVTLKKARVEAI